MNDPGRRSDRRTTAETRLLGLIGMPVSHSLSPRLHSAAIEMLGLDAVYLAFPVQASGLEAAIAGLDAAGVMGLNMTAPYKERVLRCLGSVSATATGLGAVNTIFRDETGALRGENTDVGGIRAAMEEAGVVAEGYPATVIGAGGAAAAAAIALGGMGASVVTILGRSADRARALARRLSSSGLCAGVAIEGRALSDHYETLKTSQVVVQASSAPVDEGPAIDLGHCPADAAVVEMAYEAARSGGTAFIEAARRCGLNTVRGERILVHQAALSWDLWMGRPVAERCLAAMTEISRA